MGLRLLKLIGVLALLVVLLFVSLPFLLPELIARNKSALESLLSDSLGAELRFGNAEIELFPIPEVRITEARISKKMTGAIGEMLADAPSLRLQINVMPLLMGKLELRQFTLEQGTLEARSPKGQSLWAVHNISFSGAMERAAQHLSILGIRAEYSNLTFDVQELSYAGDTQLLQISGARAGVKRGSLAFKGSVDLSTLKTLAHIDAEGIPIAEFLRTLSSFLPKDLPNALDGFASAHLELALLEDQLESLSGKVGVEGLTWGGKDNRIGSAAATSVLWKRAPAGESSLQSKVLLKGVRIRAGTDTYSAETVQSDFAFSQMDTSYEIKGNLGLGGFSYLGDGVAVDKINGDLSKAIFRRTPKGDYSLTTALRGNSLVLKSSDFSVTSAVGFGVDIISLKIPAKGGYEIKGKVDANNVSMKLSEREIRNVSGSVETFISGPLKRFGAKNLQGTIADQPVALICDFQMTAARYVASPFNIKGCGGIIQGTLSLDRTQGALLRTKGEAADLELACLEAIWQTPKGDPVKGVLKKLSIDASGSKTALPQTLKGGGSIVIQDGIIREIGVDAAFAKMLRGVPIIGSQIPLEPGTSKNDELSRTRAEAKKLEADLVFENGRIKTDNLKVGGRLGNIEAKGSYEFGKELDLTGSVIFFEKTARLLAGPIRPLQGLFGELGKVELPFRITGPLSSPLVRGNVGGILQTSAPTRFVGGVVSGAGNIVSGVGGFLFGRKATPTPEATPGPQ